jgi:hypothetical protein
MNVLVNHKIIKRRNKIGQVATLGSLAILAGGLYLSFQDGMMGFALLALALGFFGSQIGVFLGNRWGRSPRPDEVITTALKGLDNRYTLYHYLTPVPHLLIGPAGVWNIITYHQAGTITYDEAKQRWKQKGGNTYLKIFAQEGLGRPDLDIEAFSNDMNKFLAKVDPKLQETIKAKPILLFVNEKASVDANNAPVPTLSPGKFKDFIRKTAKKYPADTEQMENLAALLPKNDVK